jgi:hypothetical protein
MSSFASVEVKALRSSVHPKRFWWLLREHGRILETSASKYNSEAEALRAGAVAARRLRARSSDEEVRFPG